MILLAGLFSTFRYFIHRSQLEHFCCVRNGLTTTFIDVLLPTTGTDARGHSVDNQSHLAAFELTDTKPATISTCLQIKQIMTCAAWIFGPLIGIRLIDGNDRCFVQFCVLGYHMKRALGIPKLTGLAQAFPSVILDGFPD
jgi:hypothetical protein